MRRDSQATRATLWRILAPPLALARARLPFVLAGAAVIAMVLASRLTPAIVPAANATVPTVAFTTGAPDGRMGMASRPGNGGQVEIEAADDFTLPTDFDITSAIFTGLMPAAMPLNSVQDVSVEVYHIFPTDSINPPSGNVPTRASSPADVEFDSRDSASTSLTFAASVIASSFPVENTVVNGIHPKPNQTTGGDGSASGEEVQFNVTFSPALSLPAGHYFVVPQVQLSSGDFLWLSAAGPTVAADFQAWIRNAYLDPDWLRVGTDIVSFGSPPPKFNGSFSLSGSAPTPTPSPTPSPSPSPTPAPTHSPTPTPSPTHSPTPSTSPTDTPTPKSTATPSPTPSSTPHATPTHSAGALNGDANCDLKVDPTDALAILGDADGVTPHAPCENAEDVDCNGHVEGLDALRVLRWFIGAPMTHDAGCPEVGEPLT